MDSQVERICDKARAGRPGQARLQLVEQAVPHLHVYKLEGKTGETDHANQGSSAEK